MYVNILFVVFVSVAILQSCHNPSTQATQEKLKSELFAVEKEFCAMAQAEGVQKAFVYFAADSGVVLRGSQLVKGKEEILKKYESFPAKSKLEWAPDFADVSKSGDLGYTYGKYTLTSTDSLGKITQSGGIFHTVWKRQPDGKWRFVWD